MLEAHRIRYVPVREVGEVTLGRQRSPLHTAGANQAPYLRVANVLDGRIDYSDVLKMSFAPAEREVYELKPGDILLNEGQSRELVGRSAIYDGPPGMFFQNTLIRFRASNSISPGYARHVFKHWLDTGMFAEVSKQTTSIAHLGVDRFSSMPFPLIKLEDQERITRILNEIDRLIVCIRRKIDKIERLRTALLLEALRATSAAEPGKGWQRIPLRELIVSVDYGISSPLTRNAEGTPILRMNNLHDGRAYLDDIKFSSAPIPSSLLLKSGDVLFNRTNSIDHVGRTGIWRGELPEASFASYLVRINPITDRLRPEYLTLWLAHPVIKNRIRAISTPAVQQVNVNPSRLLNLEIDVPSSLDEQRRAWQSVSTVDEPLEHERLELRKLKTLRRGLADDLLTGRVRVTEVSGAIGG
ncbi:restriction endonuclease subunit S [Nonomuraea sp. CA-141351]|uniref:restriction endonuclease subunit S n=1 Tax=Nonomuraea sp. CA-141351 TaxID=3239996 RepID=UPI003D919181